MAVEPEAIRRAHEWLKEVYARQPERDALFTTISTWNGFLLPLVLLHDPQRSTLTVGLSRLQGQYGALNLELVSAAAILAIIPILVVFVAARRYYVQGLSAGALKQ